MARIDAGIVWQGKSLLDGSPIVAIATGMGRASRNVKTGKMIQVAIIRSDMHPAQALTDGSDVSICGACPHRMFDAEGNRQKRTCYVNMLPIFSMYQRFKRGGYQRVTPKHFKGRAVRFGSYGDPMAVPTRVWAGIAGQASKWTGYTHQWASRPHDPIKDLIMASADCPDTRLQAKSFGWRTFRVRNVTDEGIEPVDAGEVSCPATGDEGPVVTDCERCGLCAGQSRPAKDIAAIDHSSVALAARRRLPMAA